MIILACSNKKILSRWRTALRSIDEAVVSTDVGSLLGYINEYPEHVIVLHYSLDGLGGLEGITKLCSDIPTGRFLILEDVPDDMHGIELVRSGALGYGNTYLDPSVMIEAIKVIERGEIWVSKRLIQWLVNNCPNMGLNNNDNADAPFKQLTISELKILNYIKEGDSNKVIANKLNISDRTVKAHLTSIFRKTGVKDRLHLALLGSRKSSG